MSLDVYLYVENTAKLDFGSHIFIREGGRTKEITRSEWDERYPGREPITIDLPEDDGEVYTANITHNLNEMAKAAGLYEYLWRPDEIGISKASQLIDPLQFGLQLLKSDPGTFKEFNPENGWGDYDGLVEFVSDCLEACKQYPDATVRASR